MLLDVLFPIAIVLALAYFIWRAGKAQETVNTSPEPAGLPSAVESLEVAPPVDFGTFMDQRAAAIDAQWRRCRIAGLVFPNADGTHRAAHVRMLLPFEEIVARSDPANGHSMYAVGLFDKQGNQLGFIPEGFCGQIRRALDHFSPVEVYVESVSEDGGYWNAIVGVAWKEWPSVQFVESVMNAMVRDRDADEWFWARLTGVAGHDMFGNERQANIMSLKPTDVLEVSRDIENEELAVLSTHEGEIARLNKAQSQKVIGEISSGRTFIGVVADVTMRDDGVYVPKVAIARMCPNSGPPSPHR